ncbi:MAG: phosphotyrosine protein phosphatase [Terracidiphilus sp.]
MQQESAAQSNGRDRFSAYENTEALSAGVNPDAENAVSADLIEWADLVFAMERTHRSKLQQRFGSLLREKRVIVLNIPDDYGYMDQELVRILEEKVTPYLDARRSAKK